MVFQILFPCTLNFFRLFPKVNHAELNVKLKKNNTLLLCFFKCYFFTVTVTFRIDWFYDCLLSSLLFFQTFLCSQQYNYCQYGECWRLWLYRVSLLVVEFLIAIFMSRYLNIVASLLKMRCKEYLRIFFGFGFGGVHVCVHMCIYIHMHPHIEIHSNTAGNKSKFILFCFIFYSHFNFFLILLAVSFHTPPITVKCHFQAFLFGNR